MLLLPHLCCKCTRAIGKQVKLLLMQVQEMRNNISEELERCEEELDREERYGGRRRSSDTADFRDTLAGYKYVAASLVMHIHITHSVAGPACLPACSYVCLSVGLSVCLVFFKSSDYLVLICDTSKCLKPSSFHS